MTQDEIIEMVNQAGCVSYSPPPMRAVAGASMTFAQLEALIKLASAKEREACAKVCEAGINNATDWDSSAWDQACENRSYAIRARAQADRGEA